MRELKQNTQSIMDNQSLGGSPQKGDNLNDVSNVSLRQTTPLKVAEQAASQGKIIEIVEEALKWRLEASQKRQQELIAEVTEKIAENKQAFQVLSSESNTEFISLKGQIVETAADVLRQVQDKMLPVYENQVV